VTEERRVHVRCRACPTEPVLGEQVEVSIETGRLPRARLIRETAVQGFDGVNGTVWVIEDGQLAQRRVTFAARLADGTLALTDGLATGVPVAREVGSGFVTGRAARAETAR